MLHESEGGGPERVPITAGPGPSGGQIGGEIVGIGNTGWRPPDDNIATNGNYVLEAVNEAYAIWTTGGTQSSFNGHTSIQLTTLFTGAAGNSVFDPRVTYDPANGGHFILVGLEQTSSPQASNLDIAISKTATPSLDPTTWRTYRVVAGVTVNTTNYWLDFPGLGFDGTALYVTGNLFSFGSNNFLAARLMTFDKNALETATGGGGSPIALSPSVSDVITDGGSLQPAVNQTSTSVEYMVEDWDTTHLRVHTITNPLNPATYSRTTNLVTVPAYGLSVPDAPQLGSTAMVPANDTRILNAVYSNGSLYATHTIQNQANGQNKPTARWYQINVGAGSPTLNRSGSIDPGQNIATFFPSIAVDSQGNLAIGYAQSSAQTYPSAYYTTIPVSGAGTTALIVAGLAPTGDGRWGDYSGTVPDPTTPNIFYAVGESTQSTGAWGTTWVRIAQTASKIAVSAPTSDTAGSPSTVTLTVQDAGGNTITGYTGTVHFTSTDPNAVLPANYTFTTADAGAHTFNFTLKTAGTQSVTATDTTTSSITGSQTGITVNPAAAGVLSVGGFPSPTTAGASQSFTVTAKDAYGNTATGYLGTVHFTSSDGQATLPADYTFTASDAGAHTFSATLKTGGTQSITTTDTATSSITGSETSIAVNPSAASTLIVAGFPSTTTAGASQGLTVTAKDAYGNTAAGYLGTVHFTSSDGQAALPADYTFTAADAGVHTFSATLKTAGTQSITTADTTTSSITGSQAGITVNPAAASQLMVAGFPSPTTSGSPHSLTVTAKDPYGNTANGYAGGVHFTSSDGQATLPANYTFTTSDAGSHTFSATLKTAGTQSITATDTATSSITGSQTNIAVNSVGASALNVAGFLSPTTAGASQTFTVTVKDAGGNVVTGYTGTVHFTSSDSKAVLPADYTFTAADAGVHTFSATLKTAGTQSITATDTVTASITGAQAGITVNSAAVSALAVAGFPTSTVAGIAHSITVTAKDAFGNAASAYAGTIHFTTSDWEGALPANYTFTSADAGIHTFTATLKAAGFQTITATDTAHSNLTAQQSNIQVTPAAFAKVVIPSYPNTIAGVSHTFTVIAQDAYSNTITGYTGTVSFSSGDPQAVLPANYTYLSADQGKHVFSATFKTAGVERLSVVDTALTTSNFNTGVTVTPAAAAAVVVTGYASPTSAGAAHTFTATVTDAFGNIVTNYVNTVHVTSSDPQAALPANYTFTAADAGKHAFTATLKTAGTQTITLTDTAASSVTGTQAGITVNAAAASVLSVAGFPASTFVGTTQNFTVTAKDAFGNTASSYTGTVHVTSSDAQASLPGDYTFSLADAGVHTFSAALKTPGTQSITGTDTTTGSITGTESGITVTQSSISALVVTGFASPTTAGASQSFTITVKDNNGNVASGYTGTVHFTSSDPQAGLPADYAFTTSDGGVHTFSATLKTAGTQSITATDTTLTVSGTQSAITVNPAAASVLSIGGFPSTTTAGASQAISVTAKDAYGNTASGYLGTVHFTSSDGQASLPADYTFIGADAGVHNFAATLKTAGTQSVAITDTSNSSINGSQSGIAVNPAAASVLSVGGYPTATTAGASHNFTVTVKDAFGNTASGYTGTVQFTSDDLQAVLPADYTFTSLDAGVHTFSATLETAGTQSVTGTDAVSSSINGSQAGITVSPAVASSLIVAGFPSPTTSGTSQSFTVTAMDAYGNVASGYTGTLHITSSDAQAVLPVDYAFVAADAGAHTFSATLKTSGAQSITATDVASSGVTGSQPGISVVATGQAASVTVSGFPATTAGVAQSFTLTVKDAGGNVVTGYTGTIHFTSSDSKAVLPADYTFTAADAGVHTFSATLKTAGSQAITGTDTATSSVTGSQAGITVTAAAASTLAVAGFPTSTVAGVAHSLTVTAKDAFGNIAAGYTGTVHFTTTDWEGALPANYTFTAADAGSHTFSATLKAAGAQTITATDTAHSNLVGQQTSIQVSAATFSKVIILSYPSTVAGVSRTFTVAAQDAYSNTITGYTGTVSFSSSDARAVLPANYTFVAADQGKHSFSATLKTAGIQRVSVVDIALSSSNFNTAVTVTPAAAATLAISGYPSPTAVGASHSFTVTTLDAYGNVATGYVGTIHFTSTDPLAVLPADYTFTAADAGKHTFSATFKTVGTQSLTATDTVTSTITGAQTGITVQ